MKREELQDIADSDVAGLMVAQESYGDSWKKRGGIGAFMMLARKWDRIENQLCKHFEQWDVLHAMLFSPSTGIADDIRDLRRYLILVEAEVEHLAAAVDSASRKGISVDSGDLEALGTTEALNDKPTPDTATRVGYKPMLNAQDEGCVCMDRLAHTELAFWTCAPHGAMRRVIDSHPVLNHASHKAVQVETGDTIIYLELSDPR